MVVAGFVCCVALLCCWFWPALVFGDDVKMCSECHVEQPVLRSGHDLECGQCHDSVGQRAIKGERQHVARLANPAAPEQWEKSCGSCHAGQVRAVSRSLHMTHAGIINQTRYLWGAQAASYPPRYGYGTALKSLPDSTVVIRTPTDLVDNFLREACQECHLSQPGPDRKTGCSACHSLCSLRDTPEDLNKRCLTCHRLNHTGADYYGLFERDLHVMFHVPGTQEARDEYHQLRMDVHAERGLLCTDCHDGEDVMGSGSVDGFSLERTRITCQNCHGSRIEPRPEQTKAGMREGTQGRYFLDKRGREHPVPLYDVSVPAHRLEHDRIRCSACHALWTYQDYGLSVLRIDDPKAFKQDWNALTGKVRSTTGTGGWIRAYRMRRWEPLVLGVDHTGHISAMRPRFQFLVSYTNKVGRNVLDSVRPVRGDFSGPGWAFMPYVPHTVSPIGRGCESCHGNMVAAGDGAGVTLGDLALTKASPPSVPGMRLLSDMERKRLLHPTEVYGRARYEAGIQGGAP